MAKFIVVDGLDGCGKATQVQLLKEYLENKGKRVIKIDFPKYDSDSSAAVRMYLSGKLGDNASELNPYMCGTFYAVDRFIQYKTELEKYFKENDNTIILADRYLSANIIHQGGKLANREDRLEYAKWCYNLECEKAGLPKEDVTIILTITPELSQKLITSRYNGDNSKKDIHESNLEYLNECYNRLLVTMEDIRNDMNWVHISCCNPFTNEIDTVENIHNCIKCYVDKILNNEKISEIEKDTVSVFNTLENKK